MTAQHPVAETPRLRRQRAHTLSAFFAAGAALSAVVLVLPGWEDLHHLGILVTVGLAAGGAGLLRLIGAQVGAWGCHAFTVMGTALIGACQFLAGGGSATASYALLYVWVALHTSLFFGRRAITLHIAVTTAIHAAALAALDEMYVLGPALALTLGTQLVAALVVGPLAARLRHQADTDPLTGLGNRRVATRMLEQELRRRSAGATPSVCVAVLDLDGFKDLNDRDGHPAGDAVLVEAAARWRDSIRATDVLARTGGDEFTLLLPGCDLAAASVTVHRLLENTPAEVTCSAGLACWDGHETVTELIQRTDRAMYRAKREGPLVIVGQSSAPAEAA